MKIYMFMHVYMYAGIGGVYVIDYIGDIRWMKWITIKLKLQLN